MKNLLIISSTKNSNFQLSQEIKSFFDKKENISSSVISLEELDLPLFMPSLEENFKKNNSFPIDIEKVKNKILSSDALIWCSPEYNGGVSPILTNVIARISRATEDWREAFNNKTALVATHSGGDGFRFLTAFRIQLEYLGVTVYSRSITVSNSKPYDEVKVKKILANYLDLIK